MYYLVHVIISQIKVFYVVNVYWLPSVVLLKDFLMRIKEHLCIALLEYQDQEDDVTKRTGVADSSNESFLCID